jgi:predicted nucleic acid-binding protein
LVDTNVISELFKPAPSTSVLAWFAATPLQSLYISSVTLCEIELGLATMPAGKRRDALRSTMMAVVQDDFDGRCLSLDLRCAALYGKVAAARQQAGQTCSTEDAMIAAIALANRMSLVTRNTKDFEGIAGLHVINPWNDC